MAAHKLARLITKDLVTALLRAPFVKLKDSAGEGEVEEESRRDGGMREALGDLLTYPYCIEAWIVTPFWFRLAPAPRLTRFVAGILAAVTTADFLHRAYLKAKIWEDNRDPFRFRVQACPVHPPPCLPDPNRRTPPAPNQTTDRERETLDS